MYRLLRAKPDSELALIGGGGVMNPRWPSTVVGAVSGENARPIAY